MIRLSELRNELRLGNLIQDENGFIFKIKSISEHYVVADPCDENYNIVLAKGGGVRMLSPNPIRLDEELLLKCGFTYYMREHCFGKSRLRLGLYPDPGYSAYIRLVVDFNRYWFNLNIEVRHLHQLQNLYYALTGRELEIKL